MEYMEILKTVLIYFMMIVILRILGKREVGQLSIFDLVIILLLANIASLGLDNSDFFLTSIICLVVLMLLQKIISLILLHQSYLRDFVEGKPRVIIFDGKIKIKNMKSEKYTMDDLISQMREFGITSISNIYLAMLETNGKLSIFTNKIELQIISSGRFDKNMMKLLMLNENEIIAMLTKNNINYKRIISASVLDDTLIYFCKNENIEEDIEERKLRLK